MTISLSTMTIRGRPSAAVVAGLLEAANLPTSDVMPEKLDTFYALEHDGHVRGIVGLELFGNVGLLRSLVVSPEERMHGVGSRLVVHAERVAAARGVASLYLLTTTA